MLLILHLAVAADDVFIFYDIWKMFKEAYTRDDNTVIGDTMTPTSIPGRLSQKQNKDTMVKIMTQTFKHATASILVTSLTTAAALLSNCTSHITALKCFGIFSGTVILANFLLMVIWTPAVVISLEKMWQSSTYNKICSCVPAFRGSYFRTGFKMIHKSCKQIEEAIFAKLVPYIAYHFWPVVVILFTGCALVGGILIFYWPRLELPASSYVRLFIKGKGMLIENYETKYKQHFPFAIETEERENYKIRIHYVWGVFPKDNGGIFDANATVKAQLIPDHSFNMTSIESQSWIIKFCDTVLKQPFVDHTKNVKCMFDYYLETLDLACMTRNNLPYQAVIKPCCEITSFPTESWRLELCLPFLDGMAQISANKVNKKNIIISGQPLFDQQTNKPSAFWMIMYTQFRSSASHTKMTHIYNTLSNFSDVLLSTSPSDLSHGFWGAYPDLLLYDVQNAIERGVYLSISVSLGITMTMMFLTSLNLIITIYATITIVLVIFTTVACLVCCINSKIYYPVILVSMSMAGRCRCMSMHAMAGTS